MNEEELRKIARRHQAIMPLTRQEHAAAIIAAMSEAVAAERERCARICDDKAGEYRVCYHACETCAAAIRQEEGK